MPIVTTVFQEFLPNCTKLFEPVMSGKHDSLRRSQLCHLIVSDFDLWRCPTFAVQQYNPVLLIWSATKYSLDFLGIYATTCIFAKAISAVLQFLKKNI